MLKQRRKITLYVSLLFQNNKSKIIILISEKAKIVEVKCNYLTYTKTRHKFCFNGYTGKEFIKLYNRNIKKHQSSLCYTSLG